jgi:cation transporter-like permease
VAIETEYQGMGGTDNGKTFEHASRMVDEARAFGSSLSSQAQTFTESLDLRGRVQRNPIGMVLAAAGIGYVLGGGLFSSMTSRLLKVGIRLALVPVIKSQLGAMSDARTAGHPSA